MRAPVWGAHSEPAASASEVALQARRALAVAALSAAQIAEFAGNAIELSGRDGRLLALSQRACDSLTAAQPLRDRLQRALVDSPLSGGKLDPFFADVQAARAAGPMKRSDLDGSTLSLAVDSMLTRLVVRSRS